MSLQSIWTDEFVDVASQNLAPNTPVPVLSCVPVTNSGGSYQNSLKLSVEYKNIVAGNTSGLGTWYLTTIVEHLVDPVAGRWVTVFAQQEPLRSLTLAKQRRLEIQPNFDSFNIGSDEVIAPLGKELIRVSRGLGSLPAGDLRVCVFARDDDAGGSLSLTSFEIDADLELFTV